ncbi:MAG TPA: PBP1A family penicillin-binding protein [Gemmatimonadaceae bacterium]|nr:PBP1A family penicillin-binding protein [Gemmatimonadaceae bacterium]
MNETIHLSEVAIAQRYNQPLRRLLLALAILTPSLSAAQGTGAPDTAAWMIIPQPQASLVYARDGSVIGEIGKEIRTSVSIRTLPRYLPQAFIAVEDHRFYQHDGVDVVGIAGALKDNIFGERRGASTITQQLVGNMHPTLIDRTDRSIGRKLDEQAAAREMEKHYSKEQILEAYLNQIGFGHGWYGIESAAQHYFGKSASKLSIAEAAALAAMPKGPALYDPLKYPDRVRQRRNVVLALMADQGFISQAQAKAAQESRLVTQPNGGYSAYSPWYVDVVRVQATRAGIPVMQGGYRIYTGLDPVLQNAAVSALREETAALESQPDYAHPKYVQPKSSTGSARTTDYLQGLVVALDPASGDVRALVGGRDYNDSQFDRAIDGMRQPGSSFKPIVYAAAIADSIPPNAMFADTALAIDLPNKTVYRPENSDNKYLGEITLRDALAMSRNVVAVQVAMKLGMDSVAQLAYRMGINSPIAPYPSSAIGASVVQPLDLIAAYTTFANLGTPVEPRFIYRIEDRNRKIVFSREVRALAPALDPRVTYVVRDMMRDVVERGTAASIRRYLPNSIPAAGKTGTTNDNSDVWFVGLTPDVVAGVWLGFDKPISIAPGAAGGSLAAPVWGKMVARYYASKPDLVARAAEQWSPPVGVIYGDFDRVTGQLATDQTPADQRYTEYFVEGTEPPLLRADPWKLFSWGPVVF